MNILIVLNQTKSTPSLAKHDFVIGVNGGCSWCLNHNINIDLAIGDFDSLIPADLDRLSKTGVEIQRHPEQKDHTDLELALDIAMGKNPALLTVYGVWGGRTDHCLANVLCIAEQTGQTPIVMPGDQQSGYLLKNSHKITLQGEKEQFVSLLAIAADCNGISNKGLKYPLNAATLKFGTGLGLSNFTVERHSEISLQSGNLLILTGTELTANISKIAEE